MMPPCKKPIPWFFASREDWEFLVKNEALPEERMRAVETGGCPHAAIREVWWLFTLLTITGTMFGREGLILRGVASRMPGSQIVRDMVKTSSRKNSMSMIWVRAVFSLCNPRSFFASVFIFSAHYYFGAWNRLGLLLYSCCWYCNWHSNNLCD